MLLHGYNNDAVNSEVWKNMMAIMIAMKMQTSPRWIWSIVAVCYIPNVIVISFLQGNKKGPVKRWDFENEEDYSQYQSKREALPK